MWRARLGAYESKTLKTANDKTCPIDGPYRQINIDISKCEWFVILKPDTLIGCSQGIFDVSSTDSGIMFKKTATPPTLALALYHGQRLWHIRSTWCPNKICLSSSQKTTASSSNFVLPRTSFLARSEPSDELMGLVIVFVIARHWSILKSIWQLKFLNFQKF